MNEVFKKAVMEACGGSDLFEDAFSANAAKHRFSHSHKRRIKAMFKNCADPEKARSAGRRRVTRVRFAAVALCAVIVGSLSVILYGEKLVRIALNIPDTPVNTRYDELLADGDYYLNGDKSSGVYFRVGRGALTLIGDHEKLVSLYSDFGELKKAYADDPEGLREFAERMLATYETGTKYALVEAGNVTQYDDEGNEIPTGLLKYAFVERADELTEPWDVYVFLFGEFSVSFDGNKTIRLLPLGDFVRQ